MAALSVSIATFNMLLHILFLSGALAACPEGTYPHITVPQKMEALSGSCLQIPCYIPNDDIHREGTGHVGKWIKSVANNRIPNNVIFDSSKTVNIYPINIIGNLSERNCTTLFSNLIINYTDTYYFRFKNSEYSTTAACDPLQITVQDSPPSPRIEISGDLREKESVTITCSAPTPCPHSPPKLTWNLQQDPHNTIEVNTDRTFTTKIQETITLSDKHDGVTITCSATYPVDGGNYKTAEDRKTLNIPYSPRDTSVVISPTDPVSFGSVVNLTCSCRGNPAVVNFVWFMITDGRLEMIKVDTQVYGFKVTKSDRGRVYYCGCRNDLDIQLSTGRQLIFEDDQQSEAVSVEVIVKILGIIMLISTLVIFECWFRSRHSTKPAKEAVDAIYVNSAVELQPS
ncbi:sialoadhesin-like isoform X1 [Epinephelus fuscoguttatus]|uniref:sialoadhesin-like isoform X1 n=1 Tax=Epinephelus fuscoguttatus TaxID=293821 RepID=UPI0020D1E167|nr:sialoadhesin-like isoform X1 [Epinephelus fuscoguttatus]